MRNYATLPPEYHPLFTIDLQHNKKLSLLVNVFSVLIAMAMVISAASFVSMTEWLHTDNLSLYFLRLSVMLGGIVVYILLHELVHGVVMYALSGIRPHYGFTGLYAYAGSTVYWRKKDYILIALAPVVLWGAVLTVLLFLLPSVWFWPVYIIQVLNISGAAGDMYVTCRFARLPADILVNDTGVIMTVYGTYSATQE